MVLIPARYNPDTVIGVPMQVVALDPFASVYISDQQFFIFELQFARVGTVRKVIAALGLAAGPVFTLIFRGSSLFL